MKPRTHSIEPLETRIAPAVVVAQNGLSATFLDLDYDQVTIKITNGDLNTPGVFTSDEHGGTNSPIVDQLQVLDLSAAGFAGTDVTFTVVKASRADGLVNVGRIVSSRDLGKVTVPGDLGRIDCGDDGNDPATTIALENLTVRSIGLFGTATQGGGSLTSTILGPIGVIKVSGDIGAGVGILATPTSDPDGTIGSVTIGGSLGGFILASGAVGPVKITRDVLGGSIFSSAKLTSVTIGGSVFGGFDTGTGSIQAGEIGTVAIGKDLVGGAGDESGKIDSFGKITSITIGGSVAGGSGDQDTITLGGITHTGQIFAVGDIGLVKIGHDLRGASGDASGKIVTRGKLTGGLTIGGSVIGGTGAYESTGNEDGQVFAALGMGPVNIGVDVLGGAAPASALILSNGPLTSATIGGSILGGVGDNSGGVSVASTAGMIKVGHDIRGGAGMNSGVVFATGTIAGVTVGGSVIGGPNSSTGTISSDMEITAVKIDHNLEGGAGTSSGGVFGANSVSIGGSLIGGANMFSGRISGNNVSAITIGESMLGGSGVQAGSIFGNHLGNVTIDGSLVGGTNKFTGWIFSNSGIDAITIGQDFIGGSISGAEVLDSSGLIDTAGRIGSVTINGSIIAGIDDSTGALTNSARIRAFDDIGSLTVKGSLIGHGDIGKGASLVVINARGQHTPLPVGATTNVAIGKVTIGGRVEYANILAGYFAVTAVSPAYLQPLNADAQIGPVTVGGDWIASNLVAGAFNDAGTVATTDDNLNFGDFNDHKIAGGTGINSKITSITIAGQVFGSPNSVNTTDHFGFVAEQVGALKIGTRVFTLTPGLNGFPTALRSDSLLNDTTLHEIGALIGFTALAGTGAKLVNASTVTYTDADGDFVTAKLSKPLLNPGNVNNVFKFDNGTVGDMTPARQQLQLIDLGALANHGVGVTLTVTAGGGDRLAHVGAITLGNFSAGNITIPGDLGAIRGGPNLPDAQAIGALNIRSMGRLGLDAEPPLSGTFTPALGGEINGGIASLTVKQDLIGANLDVLGKIGPVNIGGSLIGGADTNSGLIATQAGIGAVTIGGDVQGGTGPGSGRILSGFGTTSLNIDGSIIGGAGEFSGAIDAFNAFLSTGSVGAVKVGGNLLGGTGADSGQILAGDLDLAVRSTGKITSLTLGGALLAGSGVNSARIYSTGDMGVVNIGGDVQGRGDNSGSIVSEAKLAGATLGGSLIGGGGDDTGSIQSNGDMGPVKIAFDLLGGDGSNVRSGIILSAGKLGSVTIGGSVLGGTSGSSAVIISLGNMGAVKIGGNMQGADGGFSGAISAGNPFVMPVGPGKIASVTIGGSLLGGASGDTGEIRSTDDIGLVSIGGNMLGAAGTNSAFIMSDRKIAGVTIGGSLVGGSDNFSGQILGVAGLGAVKIGYDFVGGTDDYSGRIATEGFLTSVTIGGSMTGGSNDTSTPLMATAIIESSNDISALRIGGNLTGGTLSGTGFLSQSGYVEGHSRILSVVIGGTMLSGSDHSASANLTANASIRATGDIASFLVKGNIVGNTTTNGDSRVIISARHRDDATATSDVVIGKFTVLGRVERANILAGYDVNPSPANANAQIGTVTVGGEWIASNLIAGVENDAGTASPNDDNINFGDTHDHLFGNPASTIAKIASITIKGTVIGSAASGDHFGFVTNKIGSFKLHGTTIPVPTPITVLLSGSTGQDATIVTITP